MSSTWQKSKKVKLAITINVFSLSWQQHTTCSCYREGKWRDSQRTERLIQEENTLSKTVLPVLVYNPWLP